MKTRDLDILEEKSEHEEDGDRLHTLENLMTKNNAGSDLTINNKVTRAKLPPI